MADSSPLRWQGSAPGPSHAHPDTRASTVSTLSTLRPPPPRHDAPRAPPAPSPPAPSAQPPRPLLARGAMAAARPCRASGRPGRGAPPGRAPRPLSPAPSPGLAPQLLPRSAPRAPAAAARPLAPSLGRAAARSRLRRVPARGDGSGRRVSSRRVPRGRARRSRTEARARPAAARAASWFRPARAREPRGPSHPVRGSPGRDPEPPGAYGGWGEGRAPRTAPCRRGEWRPLSAPEPGPTGPRAHAALFGSARPPRVGSCQTVVVALIGPPPWPATRPSPGLRPAFRVLSLPGPGQKSTAAPSIIIPGLLPGGRFSQDCRLPPGRKA